MITRGWVDPARYGRTHTGYRTARSLDAFAPHIRLARPAEVYDQASVADALVPACDRDAGWSSAGDRANAELRAIATGRGPLRRVLDDLRPGDGGVR